ncbi:MAG: cysteine-rich CWC family protein [Hyphomicrobiaceae bacterium]
MGGPPLARLRPGQIILMLHFRQARLRRKEAIVSEADAAWVTSDRCPSCGNPVGCGITRGEPTCWCVDLPHRMPIPANESVARCYCRACLQRLLADQTISASSEAR